MPNTNNEPVQEHQETLSPENGQPSAPKKKKKKPLWRRMLRWGIWSLVLILVLPFFILFMWNFSTFRGVVTSIGFQIAGGFLEGELKGELGGDLLTGVKVRKFRWHDRNGKVMVGFEELRVSYNLVHFLQKGELLVEEVILVKPMARLSQNKKGEINLLTHIRPSKGPKKKPKPKKKTGPSTFRLTVRDITIKDLDAELLLGQKMGAKNFQFKGMFAIEGDKLRAEIFHIGLKALFPDITIRKLALKWHMLGDDMGVDHLHLDFGKDSYLRLPKARITLGKLLKLYAKISALHATSKDIKRIAAAYPVKPDINIRSLEAKGHLDDLQVQTNIGVGASTISLKAKAGILRQFYEVKLALEKMNLQELLGNPALKSDLNLSLTAKGSGFSDKTNGAVALLMNKSSFQKYKLKTIDMKIRMRKGLAKLNSIKIHTPYAHLDGWLNANLTSGRVLGDIKGTRINLKRVGRLIGQRMAGGVSFRLLLGDKKNPSIQKWMPKVRLKYLKVRRFWHPAARVARAHVSAKVDAIQPELDAHAEVKAYGIRAGGQNIRYFRIKLHEKLNLKTLVHDLAIQKLRFNIGTGLFLKKNRRPIRVAFDGKTARIKNFYLKNGPEELHVNGSYNLKGNGQDMTVRVVKFNLKKLRKALRIMPKSKLAGKVSAYVYFGGTFPEPKIKVEVDAVGARFQKYKELGASIRLAYRSRGRRRDRRLLKLKVDVSKDTRPFLQLVAKVPLKHLNLRRFPKQPIHLKRPIFYSLQLTSAPKTSSSTDFDALPGYSVDWVGKLLKMPFGGKIKTRMLLKGSVSKPNFTLDLGLENGRWQKIKGVDMGVTVRYRKNELHLSRLHATNGKLLHNWLSLKGKRLIEFSGKIPLLLRIFERRRKIKVLYRLPDKDFDFNFRLLRQRLKDFFALAPKKIQKQLEPIDSDFHFGLRLQGRPTKPKIDMGLSLSDMSFCPLENGKLSCYVRIKREDTDYTLSRTGRFSFGRRRSRSFRRSYSRGKALHVKGAGFHVELSYRPEAMRLKNGKKVGKFSVSRFEMYVPNQKKRSRRSQSPFQVKVQNSWFAMDFGVHPRTFVPKIKLYDPMALHLVVPDLSIQWVAEHLVRIGALKKLKGDVKFSLHVKNKLSDPRVTMGFHLTKGAYLYKERTPDKPAVFIDGISNDFVVSLKNDPVKGRMGVVDLTTKVFNKTVLDFRTALGLKAIFDVNILNAQLSGKKRKRKRKSKKKLFELKFGNRFFSKLRIPNFPLHSFKKLGGPFKKISGRLNAFVKLQGDPACPTFAKVVPKKGGKPINSFFELKNLLLGEQKHTLKRKTQGLKTLLEPPANLHLKKIGLSLSHLKDGRTRIDFYGHRWSYWGRRRGSWYKYKRPRLRYGALVGNVEAFVPLGPSFKMSLKEAKRRCPSWPGGKRSKKLKVTLGSEGASLNFLEAFLPGMEVAGKPSIAIRINGRTDNPIIEESQVSLTFSKLAYPAYGLRLGRACYFYKLKGKDGRIHNFNRCSFTRINITLRKKFYELAVSFQGVKGKKRQGGLLYILGKDGSRNSKGRLRYVPTRNRIYHKNFIPTRLDLGIRAKSFRPMATKRYRMTMATHIKIRGTLQAPKITGTITIPELLFTLPESSRKPGNYKEDKDIIVLGEKGSQERLQKLFGRRVHARKAKKKGIMDKMLVNLVLIIPRNCWIKNRDLSVEAKTDSFSNLRVILQNGRLTLTGGIEMVRGEYNLQLYTVRKRFVINPGSWVRFTGQSSSLSNLTIAPRLKFAAIYIVNLAQGTSLRNQGLSRLKVFLLATGSAFAPKIDFEVRDYATDRKIQMDRLNIISLIVTGSTSDDLSQGQRQNMAKQTVGMFGQLIASQVQNAIASIIPIDVFKIDAGTGLEDFKVKAGWYLNPRVYLELGFKPVPLEEESLWDARLDLSLRRSLSLEVRGSHLRRNDALRLRFSTHLYFKTKR